MSMGVNEEADVEPLENNENVADNTCDLRWRVADLKNCSGSQEMFSDDDNQKDTTHFSPKITTKNDNLNNSSIISLRTPVLFSKVNNVTPGRAIIPKTPVDLLPFIKKTDVMWTSDMETPEGSRSNEKCNNCDRTVDSIDINNRTPNLNHTQNRERKKTMKMNITSPVLGGKKKSKKRVKRRILSTALDFDNDDQQSTISSSSDKVPSEAASSASNEIFIENEIDYNRPNTKEYNKLDEKKPSKNSHKSKELNNKKLEDAVVFDKNSNTSTQEFFSNASFSIIDRLCDDIIEEEKSIPESKVDTKINSEIIKEETNREENTSEIMSHDVLERIASIKRSQKPLRRSTDVNHTVISKDVFLMSARALEIADKKFSQETKRTPNTQGKPSRSSSFQTLSSIENECMSNDTKPPIKLNSLDYSTQDVPIEMMDDWNNSQLLGKENLNIKFNNGNLIALKTNGEHIIPHIVRKIEDGFSTAHGKNIVISEDKILKYARVYNEIENENLSENTLLQLKSNQNQLKRLNYTKVSVSSSKQQPNLENQQNNFSQACEEKKFDDGETKSLKLFQQYGLDEFLKPKLEPVPNVDDGFTTAKGQNIKVDREKETYYSKIYNELNDCDEDRLLNLKKDKQLCLGLKKKPRDKAVIIFNTKDSNLSNKIQTITKTEMKTCVPSPSSANEGFSTAGGKNIKINTEKESYYSKVYNELDVNDVSGLLKTQKTSMSRSTHHIPSDKAVIIFRKNEQSSSKNDCSTASGKLISKLSNIPSACDGFSTAHGNEIQVNSEKEQYYSKVYNELDDGEITGILDTKNPSHLHFMKKPKDQATTRLNKVKTEAVDHEIPNANFKATSRAAVDDTILPINQIKTENVSAGLKLSISSDTDEVFHNISDIEAILTPTGDKKYDDCLFVVPNSENIFKKIDATPTIKQEMPDTKENLQKIEKITEVSRTTMDVFQNFQKKTNVEVDNRCKNLVGLLKRKLDMTDMKAKTGRCRSFGGFPVSTENVTASKLNKSDPVDESLVNQPLHQGMSVSQCFDSHSDSWLSKVEISLLNNSKIKSPEHKIDKSGGKLTNLTRISDFRTRESNEFLGFTHRDLSESFRKHFEFQKSLEKQNITNNFTTKLVIEKDQKFNLSNQTTSAQEFSISFYDQVHVERNGNGIYSLHQSKPAYTVIENRIQEKNKTLIVNIAKVAEKRKKLSSTDSDTPLTTFKKPRVGSELQGRRLFSDELENDDHYSNKELENEEIVSIEEVSKTVEFEDIDLTDERLDAIFQQNKIIRNKKRQKIKPIPGILTQKRIEPRRSWVECVGSANPSARTIEKILEIHSDRNVLGITASNALQYTFTSSNIVRNKKVVSLDVGDSANLIFDENGHAGISEFSQAFLAMPGVDPKLLPTGWIENHYKWIVWKLASYDKIDFGCIEYQKMLIPERVMQELKYRYDREIDKAQRPALRRVLEKDDIPSRLMTLCISSIIENTSNAENDKEVKMMLGLSRWKIEATDGWYDIPLTVDSAMTNHIANGKIKEGTKIVTYGAELLECERGFYPLEKPSNVSLKIHTNCTRRARWDTKLGYQKYSRPIPVRLRDIVPNGGMIGETTAVAARVYPFLYREKTADGQSIYRNARSEEKAAIAYEQAIEKKMEVMYAEAQKNFDSKKKSGSDDDDSQNSSRAQSTRSRERKHEEMKQQVESQVREGLPPPRQVTPVLKVRLFRDDVTVMLTIWGASEDSGCDIKEGDTISVYNPYASGSRGGELNLTANRITHIKKESLLKLPYPERTCTLIPDIGLSGFDPKFCEFDTVGIVVSTGPAPYGMKNFETVNLAYPKSGNTGAAYLSILFWNGVASFGYQGMLGVGALVACSNIEWRRNTSWSVPVAYCSEKSLFTCNPRSAYLAKEIRDLRSLVQNPTAYAKSCSDDLTNELAKRPLQPRSNQATPTGGHSFGYLSGVSPMNQAVSGYTPGSSSIQRKLEKLSRYDSGSTTDISPIIINNSSQRVKKDFTPVTASRRSLL